MGRGGGPSTRALAPPAAVHARLTVNRVVWRLTWAIADHSKDHTLHPADQGLHFEQILGFLPVSAAKVDVSKRSPQKGGASPNSKPELSFCTIGNKMQETRNKMPAASVYLLEKTHFLQLFVAEAVTGSCFLDFECRKCRDFAFIII